MVVDHLSRADVYRSVTKNMHHAFEFLNREDHVKLALGKHPIAGDEVYAMVQEYRTNGSEQGKWEAHRKYLDVQYIVSGVERMGYAYIEMMQVSSEYDEVNDYLLFTGHGNDLIMTPGTFAIFWPQDVHRPMGSVGQPLNVRKIVVKVRVD